jgi:nicotinamidase-related amidase
MKCHQEYDELVSFLYSRTSILKHALMSRSTSLVGFQTTSATGAVALDKHGSPKYAGGDQQFEDGKNGQKYSGMGSEMGSVTEPSTGKTIDAGRLLMRDQWNSALYPPLDAMYEEGKNLEVRPDVWLHKNRMSGMWGASTMCEEFLKKEGIRTLFFTGVNTDQCVGGTYQDCFSKGYDCVLLSDGCGTTSPDFSQQSTHPPLIFNTSSLLTRTFSGRH